MNELINGRRPPLSQQQVVRHDFVDTLVERANKAQGLAAAYLACIAGMWSDALNAKPTTQPSKEIRDWFDTGIAASKTARTRHA